LEDGLGVLSRVAGDWITDPHPHVHPERHRQQIVTQQAPRLIDADGDHVDLRRLIEQSQRSARPELAQLSATAARALGKDRRSRAAYLGELSDGAQRLIGIAAIDDRVACGAGCTRCWNPAPAIASDVLGKAGETGRRRLVNMLWWLAMMYSCAGAPPARVNLQRVPQTANAFTSDHCSARHTPEDDGRTAEDALRWIEHQQRQWKVNKNGMVKSQSRTADTRER
jgi:hypothetical protein